MSEIEINYNNYDFFYVKAGDKTPSIEECNSTYKIIPESKCEHFPTLSNIFINTVNNCGKYSFNDMEGCLLRVDNSNSNRTNYLEDYRKWVIWDDNSFNCYRKEICINRDNAKKIKEMQEDHLATEENYKNSKSSYKNELWKTGNLSMGIVLLTIIIYYLRKNANT